MLKLQKNKADTVQKDINATEKMTSPKLNPIMNADATLFAAKTINLVVQSQNNPYFFLGVYKVTSEIAILF